MSFKNDKKSNLVYFLIFIVLIIWGLVFIKINSYLIKPKNNVRKSINSFAIENLTTIDTFNLRFNFKDPFKINKRTVGNKKNVERAINQFEQFVAWPGIQVKGYVYSEKNNEQKFVVIINNKSYFMKIRDTINGITLIKVEKDSILFIYKNKIKKIFYSVK